MYAAAAADVEEVQAFHRLATEKVEDVLLGDIAPLLREIPAHEPAPVAAEREALFVGGTQVLMRLSQLMRASL